MDFLEISAISAGKDQTLALLTSGEVLGWGGAGSGRLVPPFKDICGAFRESDPRPVYVSAPSLYSHISAGYGVSLGISDQKPFAWGFSQTGMGGHEPISEAPSALAQVASASKIAAGQCLFGLIDEVGGLHTWGLNVDGALGRKTGQINASPAPIPGIPPMQDVFIGDCFMLALSDDQKVYAWGSSFHQGQYLLASTADEILMNKFGDVGLEGFGIWQNYFQSALNKLGVNVHIFRVGAYKSAVEPYSRSNMSEESRSNYTKLLGDLWTDFVHDVETNRKLKPGTVNDYINHFDQHLADYKGNSAELAKALGLVDRIDSRPDALAYLKQQIGTRGEDLNTIDFRDYLHAVPAKVLSPSHKIAVIVADGEIVDGEAQPGSIGGDTLAALIRKAAQDDGVKALVLRINSPGGSAFASELIRSELVAFKANGRPLVVSMGDTAASGGYWIASAANKIIASPVTLTGSIGIFGTMFTLEESFNKLGIGTDGVGTTELAGYSAIGRPLTPMAGRALQLQIEHGYEKFLTLVSESRDLDHAQADAVGQGQVWSGKAALEKKLIDAYGNQQDAIKAAAALANLEEYQVDVRAPSLSPLQQFIKRLAENEQAQTLLTPLLKSYFTLSPVQLFLHKAEAELGWLARANDPQHVYVRCLECDSVKL